LAKLSEIAPKGLKEIWQVNYYAIIERVICLKVIFEQKGIKVVILIPVEDFSSVATVTVE